MAVVDDRATPLRIVNAAAPIRICDNGGWTDTWFAGHGRVFNIGVSPSIEVQINLHPIGALPAQVVLHLANFGERYAFDPPALPDRHPLLEAAIDEIGLPEDVSAEISVYSEAPAGGSMGTSASTTVALIGALDALSPGRLTPLEIAYVAHRIEVDRVGHQSGIQDQICAAYGGINYIEIFAYPNASVIQLSVPDATWWELDQRLVLFFLGRTHTSSEVHDRVIAELACDGGRSPRLEALRRAADAARDAVLVADFGALGRAMTENTAAQRGLHPSLISDAAQTTIEIAASHGALGSKVNGAGGEGGSVTVLCGPDTSQRRRLVEAVCRADPHFQIIPTHVSRHGLRVWQS
jgi:D-glycero-alpha-D-manno-heptose-7-phosphate kinase